MNKAILEDQNAVKKITEEDIVRKMDTEEKEIKEKEQGTSALENGRRNPESKLEKFLIK